MNIYPHVWNISMPKELTLRSYIAPTDQGGVPDQRFNASLERILAEIGEEATQELLQFAKATAVLQRQAASAGLQLAIAIFNEATYLDNHHRFDDDNKYGWQSKSLRKQARRIIEQVGFMSKNAHKLVSTANWIATRYSDKAERTWFDELTPSHLYELSRMSDAGLAKAKQEVCFEGFHFSAGQQEITVRRLEDIRRDHPKLEAADTEKLSEGKSIQAIDLSSGSTKHVHQDKDAVAEQFDTLVPAVDSREATTTELVEQLVSLVKAIDWSTIKDNQEAMETLSSVEYTWSQINEVVDDWKYLPLTLTHA